MRKRRSTIPARTKVSSPNVAQSLACGERSFKSAHFLFECDQNPTVIRYNIDALDVWVVASVQTGRSERTVILPFRHCFCVFFWNEAMTRLVEIRNQEMLCRERALTEPERREFWLVQADEWAQRALNEIASDLHVMAHMGQATAKQDIRAL